MNPPFRKLMTPRSAEFYLRRPENLVLVRTTVAEDVLVCATADNLSMAEKDAFIHYLCAEGFMTAECEPQDRADGHVLDYDGQMVKWIVDPTWPEIDPIYALHIQRLAWYTAGILIVFVAMTAGLICC